MLVARVGDVLALNPGEVHTGVPFGPDGVQYHMIYPEAALLRRLLGGLDGNQAAVARVKAPIIHDPDLAEELLIVLTASTARRGTTRWERRLATGLRQLWARHADPAAPVEAAPTIPPAIQRVRQYIDSHLADHLDIGTLASVATLTPYQLVRQFHGAFGLPPHRFLLDARIRRAKRLIQEDTPLAAVALRTGFCDQSHLTRHFRRVVGVPPGQYARAFE
jgi:AraC-like DNA-binding protein